MSQLDKKDTPMEKFNLIRQIILFLVDVYRTIRGIKKDETKTNEQK